MERSAQLINLRNVRDLEMAKRKIEILFNTEKENCQRKYNELNSMDIKEIPAKEVTSIVGSAVKGILLFLIGGGAAALMIYQMAFGTSTKVTNGTVTVNGVKHDSYVISHVPIGMNGFLVFIAIMGIIFALVGLYFILKAFADRSENKDKIRNTKIYNKNEQLKVQQNAGLSQELEARWKERSQFLQSEYKKVVDSLTLAYDANIVPQPYRKNLAAIFYIYDYMSTSQETLSATLMHTHLEDGIQRISAKLDCIIEQNQEVIFQNRIKEANDRQMIKQTDNMLASLQRTEKNTETAAQYAQISAACSKANAYFSLANYLKN